MQSSALNAFKMHLEQKGFECIYSQSLQHKKYLPASISVYCKVEGFNVYYDLKDVAHLKKTYNTSMFSVRSKTLNRNKLTKFCVLRRTGTGGLIAVFS